MSKKSCFGKKIRSCKQKCKKIKEKRAVKREIKEQIRLMVKKAAERDYHKSNGYRATI